MVANRYYDGRHYDQRYAGYTHDLQFWIELGRRYGPRVLELATGTGRVSIPLAQAGCEVVGIDISPSMLQRAEANRGAVANPELLLADIRSFSLDRRFDLVLLPCSSIAHLLAESDVAACLRAVREHLAPDGVFTLDTLNPTDVRLADCDEKWRRRFSYPDPTGNGVVNVTGRQSYDRLTRILTDDLEYQFTATNSTERVRRRSRLLSSSDLDALLAASGFDVIDRWGGFDGEPFTADSPVQVLSCRPTETEGAL